MEFCAKHAEWTKRDEADWRLFFRSEAFRRILVHRPCIESALRAHPMKILPVRYVARLFHVSERLLWNWIEQRVLSTCRRSSKHPEHHKKGITLRVVQEFLRRLDKCGERRRRTEESGGSLERRTRTRSAPAKMKCQEGEKLLRGWTPTPRQYADAVGVSVSTVYRLLREERLSYYRPTKRRIVLCHLLHKNRNRLLTRRAQEKLRESLERPREDPAKPRRCYQRCRASA